MRAFPGVAAFVAALGLALPLVLAAPAAHADDYPTWSQVQAAKASEAATQTEVTKITGLLGGLQSTAARLGGVAVKRAAASARAQAQLETAEEKATRLAQERDAAKAKAKKTRVRVGRLLSELYRTQATGATLRVFLSGADAGDLLYRLGAVTKLTQTASALRGQAQRQDNLVGTLSDQASAARDARDALAVKARDAASAARDAASAADAELAATKKRSDTLYAQLAALKNTTAKVEKKYEAGVRAREAYREQQEAARRAAKKAAEEAAQENSSGGGSGGSSSGGSSTGTAPPPSGITVDPAAAQSYARGRMGAYGWGSDQFQCLIWLWNQESGWRADAYNTSSGAYGIPQSLPGSKMASTGSDWRTNAVTQINWGLGYIAGRYSTPCGAWAHEVRLNWY